MAKKPETRTMIPPFNEEAERAVIGSILLEPECYKICRKMGLKPESFFLKATAYCYEMIEKIVMDGKIPDVLLLADELTKAGKLEEAGGNIALDKFIDATPTAVHLQFYADIVARKWQRRQMIEKAREVEEQAFTSEDPEEELISKAKYCLSTLQLTPGEREPLIDVAHRLNRSYAQARHSGPIGIPSRFYDVNQKITGFFQSKMTILAARPGTGKTTMMLNEILHKGLMGIASLVVSIEMTVDELLDIMIGDLMELDIRMLRQGKATQEQIDRHRRGGEIVSKLPIYLEYGNQTPESYGALIREYKAEHNIQLVGFDYIQLLQASTTKKFNNRNAELTHGCNKMIHVGNETGVHQIVLSQLTRYFSSKHGQVVEPQLHHLRDCGALEQDACNVGFLNPDVEEEQDITWMKEVPMTLKWAKAKFGGTGRVSLTFQKEKQRFVGGDNKGVTPDMFDEQTEMEIPF